MKVSVIAPCYNEEKVVLQFIERVRAVLTRCLVSRAIQDFEMILVDDGSSDNTLALIKSQTAGEPRIKAVSFSRNFGHQAAIAAGLNYSSGDATVVIDCDLQDPPELIPDMLEKFKEGYSIVHTKRKRRRGEGVFKKVFAGIFYRVLNCLSTVKIPEDSGDFKLLDSRVVAYLRSLKEHHRFMRGLEVLAGFRQVTIEYDRAPRLAGEPKYSFWKSLGLALDGITSLSSRPLKLVTYFGLIGIASSLGFTVYAFVSKFLYPDKVIPGWTSLLIAFTFFSGIQLCSLGLIGEYVGRIFEEVKDRPLYVTRETVNL